ncbi:MAG: SEC-C domain-containing protein [Deltaproteobacteria bacterium]|nr:MAG: SEC-C domain-containing protein [Deltaproteobacteria bacterium]
MADMENQEKPNKEIMDAILQVIDGGNPEEIAQKVGLPPEQLVALSDSFVQQHSQTSLLGEAAERKIGRNEPCPCGSGKKYKKCCLRKHEKIKDLLRGSVDFEEPEAEEEGPPEYVVKGFDLLAANNYEEAINYAKDLLSTYPEDDRIHDTLGSAYLATRQYDEAIDICRTRWDVSKEEKAFFIERGHHKRLPEGDDSGAPHFYAPETWLEKYWIALKAKDYSSLIPEPQNPEISRLIAELETANDLKRFPEQQEKGLEQRREALTPTLEKLKAAGPDALPYLLQMMSQFSWATLFVPEIIAYYPTESAIHSLMDITMFNYHYVSEACLKHLEGLGADVLPHIRDAFSRDKEFDPLKVGFINMLSNLEVSEVDDLLVELLDHEEPAVVDWAGLVIGKRNRTDLLPALEEANGRIGNKPRIGWAIERLRKLEEEKK